MGYRGKDLLDILLVVGYIGTTFQETSWKYMLKSYFELALQMAPKLTRGGMRILFFRGPISTHVTNQIEYVW